MVLRIGVRLASTMEDVGEYLADATALEAAGVDSLWLEERSVLPVGGVGGPPGLDPWPLLAGVAAVTRRVRVGTAVSAIAAWPPILFATVAASLDRLSRGRLVIGAGTGDAPERFDGGGLPLDDRGRRLDEFVEAVRGVWSGSGEPFSGDHYVVPGVAVAAPVRPGGPPILFEAGGVAEQERAARLGDGLIHPGGPLEEVTSVVTSVLGLLEHEGRGGGFELWAQVPAPASRMEWRQTLAAYESAGLTGLIVAHDPRLLDLLRNPDAEDDRSDLVLAQG